MAYDVPRAAGAALKDLLRGYSAEVTSGDRKSIEAAKTLMAPGSEVFVASLPADPPDRLVTVAAELRRAGRTPVPHVVARNIKDRVAFDQLLARLAAEAGIDRVLLLAGDRDRPSGEFSSSLELIETGLLAKHGVSRIFLSWYPEGHPRISVAALDAARTAKLAAAASAGLAATLVSQFCFESSAIIATARKIQSEGVRVPLRVGVAGPASRMSLLKYAIICGVGASMRALQERPGARNLIGGDTPEELLTDIAHAQAAEPTLNIEAVHFFTFSSLDGTAKFVEQHTRAWPPTNASHA